MVQTALLEGGPGGGCVYEAVALGIPIIISDIQVNLEIQGEPDLYFFKVQDSRDLSNKMLLLLDKKRQQFSAERLDQRGELRRERLGDELIRIIELTLSIYRLQE